ncbi:MAG: hypothetical protein AAGU74_11415 [Bacillota bacterium]
MEFLLVGAVFIAISLCLVFYFKKNGWSGKRLLALVFLLLSLLLAWLLKKFNTSPVSEQLLPFYKLFNISDYGYQSILSDLVRYALPFMPAGFFLVFVFPGAGILSSMLCGLGVCALFCVPGYLSGNVFIADELVLAAIGMGIGSGVVILLAHFLQKKSWFGSTGLVAPSKGRFRAGFAICALVYLGIALIMIADYGAAYGELQLFRGETPLPAEITADIDLESDQTKASIYSASQEEPLVTAKRIAEAFGMSGDFTEMGGKYAIAAPDGGMLTFSTDGSWEYTYEGAIEGAIPDAQSAETIARTFIRDYAALGLSVSDVVSVIVKDNTQALGEYSEESAYSRELYDLLLEEAKKPIGVDIYFNASIDGHSVIGANEVMVSVRAGGTVTRLRKSDADLHEVAIKPIVSVEQAWDQLLSGEGSHTLFDQVQSARLNKFELAYMLESTKGNYLPIWRFFLTGIAENGDSIEFEAYVSALK